MLLVLAAAAGSTDAISYLGLGKVFPANMTGNTVLLGVGIAQGAPSAAARSALALAGFLAGATMTAFAIASTNKPKLLRRGLAGELAVLAAACGLWLATGDHPTGARQHWLIALVSLAMGAQSATVSSLDVGVSTTFITGTWTALCRRAGGWLRGLAGGTPPSRRPERSDRRLLILATYFGAALVAGCLKQASGAVAAAIPPALLAVALAGCRPAPDENGQGPALTARPAGCGTVEGG